MWDKAVLEDNGKLDVVVVAVAQDHGRTGRKQLGGRKEICPTFSDCARVVKKKFQEKLSKILSTGGGDGSLLTDVVVLTPSDENLPSAYPSAKLNSATSVNQNLPSKFWKVTSADLLAE
jgi:hypothetical protein